MECTNHQKRNTRYCTACGALLNRDVAGFPGCREYHREYASWGWKFCPDCGTALGLCARPGGGGLPNEQEPHHRLGAVSQVRTFRI